MKYHKQVHISDRKKPKPYLARMKCNKEREWSTCSGRNQKCHFDKIGLTMTKPFCGTHKCRALRDCKGVGHAISGHNSAANCKKKKGQRKGRCVYQMFQSIA